MTKTTAWTGCTCARCGTRWPDPAPADGRPVFCDGVCEAGERPANPLTGAAAAAAVFERQLTAAEFERLMNRPLRARLRSLMSRRKRSALAVRGDDRVASGASVGPARLDGPALDLSRWDRPGGAT